MGWGWVSWHSQGGNVASQPNFSRWKAKLALAFLFFAHLFKRAFFLWKRRSELPRFLSFYAADAITPISEAERSRFPSFQRCQICSLCTFSCSAIQQGRAPGSFEPKFLMTGFGRSSHESEYFLPEWLPCAECAECTVKCPNDVPVHAMAEQIIERRKNLAFRSE